MPKTGAQERRRLGMVLAAAVAVTGLLLGCTRGGAASADPHERPLVLTTFTVLADMVRNVGGDLVRVESVTDVGAEIHGYEPTPDDVRRGLDADLVLDNGLGLEAWFERFLGDVEAPHAVLSDGVEVMTVAGTDVPNPHAWMSPEEGQVYIDNIVAALSELDPDNAEAYAANGADYATRLAELQAAMRAALGALPADQRVLVTCEGAFSYLARDAGLEEAYLWPLNAEAQSTPRQVTALIDRVRADRVPAVFCESTVSDTGQREVAASTGARFGGTLYVDSLSTADGPVPTYLDLLRHDVSTIVAGLTGEEVDL